MTQKAGRFALILALLSAALVACRSTGSEDEIPLPDTTPFSSEQAESIHEIRDAVMDIRDLKVTSEINEGTLTREEIREYYEVVNSEIDDEDRREMENYNTAFRMLRIIGPDDDLLNLFTDFWSDASAGFYSLDDDKLVLIGDASDLGYEDRSTLAHEYAHSLQDASFDLDKFDELAEEESGNDDGASSEYNTTLSCVIEGDAEVTQYLFEAQVLGPEEEGAGQPPAASFDSEIPPGFLRYMVFNYNECAIWALSLYIEDGGDWDEIDDAYSEPPWTTEQIMHPEKYMEREDVTGLRPLDLRNRMGGEWKRTESVIFGEFDLYNYLATVLEDEGVALDAAEGWGVGWLGIYTEDGDTDGPAPASVVTVSLEFDTRSDFDEFKRSYEAVTEKLGGSSVTRSEDGDIVCWQGELEHALVVFYDTSIRADLLMATDEESLRKAASGPLSSGETVSCPGW
jgi:hypothetical protein